MFQVEVERKYSIITVNLTREIRSLKEQIDLRDIEKRNEIYAILIIGFIVIYIYLFYTQQKYVKLITNETNIQEVNNNKITNNEYTLLTVNKTSMYFQFIIKITFNLREEIS